MLPLRDDVPSRTFPFVTVGLIALNAVVFFSELARGPGGMQQVAYDYGFVPGALTAFASGEGIPAGRAFLPLLSSMFLHGGWLHLIGNMWYLWIFGDNVEDRLGHLRFLIFYILCGLIGNFAHYTFNSGSTLPVIGASGAVSGVLGAYLISYPRARILVLLPLFLFWQFIELPALVVLGFWLVLQFLNGAASAVFRNTEVGVAWWAHVGGFLGGMIVLWIFRPRPRVAYRRDDAPRYGRPGYR
jgi:membrane associated rhomboid family serine protease